MDKADPGLHDGVRDNRENRDLISAIGLAAALVLLIWMTVRGVNILLAGPIAAALVARRQRVGVHQHVQAIAV